MTSTTQTPTAEELLKNLMSAFFYTSPGYGGITWQFVDGVTLATYLGPEYEAHYALYLSAEERKTYEAFQKPQKT